MNKSDSTEKIQAAPVSGSQSGKTKTPPAGVVEQAVSAHNPSPAVLLEARALDRELAAPSCSWTVLTAAVTSFKDHFPAILLRSPAALATLGEGCLAGARQAQAWLDRVRCSATLVELMQAVVGEGSRERVDTISADVPGTLDQLVVGMAAIEELCSGHAHLFEPLLELGKQVVLVGDEGNPPQAWFSLLGRISRLLLKIVRARVSGEPFYDDRWNEPGLATVLDVDLLEAVRRERIDADLAWIAALEADLSAERRPAMDVFLELDAFEHRDERATAWREWFERISAKVAESGIATRTLRILCSGFADWIRQADDRAFLGSLARILRRDAPRVAAANGEAGLLTALDTFGGAIIERLESEAGRGEIDQAAEDLRAAVAEIIEKLAESSDGSVLARVAEEANRLRTGPLVGAPLSRQDAIFGMSLLARFPHLAESLLYSLLAGFSIEECMLRDVATGQGSATVGQALCGLLQSNWPPDMLHSIRAAVRVVPLSPFHLGGPTIRAHLLALDPGNRPGFYLHDMKEHILSRPGPQELEAVQGVLRFWISADASCLQSFLEPESMSSLADDLTRGLVDDLRRILENLRRHAPVGDKSGVGWLAALPDAYYQADTLKKVAAFPGCSEQAFTQLFHLLNVYRTLARKHARYDAEDVEAGLTPAQLVERASDLIERRGHVQARIFEAEPPDERDSIECLDLFAEDLALMHRAEGICERIAGRSLGENQSELELAARVLACMLKGAALSGLGAGEFEGIAEEFAADGVDSSRVADLLRRITWLTASERNALAGRIQPHVEDSVRRLLANPLSRPAASYAELFEAHRGRGSDRLSIELSHVLVDDLLAADGGLPLLDDYAHRLLHFIERYDPASVRP